MLKAIVIIGTALPALMCGALLLSIGHRGLYATWTIFMAPLFGVGYGFIGEKDRSHARSPTPAPTTSAPGSQQA